MLLIGDIWEEVEPGEAVTTVEDAETTVVAAIVVLVVFGFGNRQKKRPKLIGSNELVFPVLTPFMVLLTFWLNWFQPEQFY